MPLKRAPKGSSKKTRQKIASANIGEMHHSSRFASAKRKFGAAKAHKMAIAAGLSGMRRKAKRRKKK
jgi:hypothetical protein